MSAWWGFYQPLYTIYIFYKTDNYSKVDIHIYFSCSSKLRNMSRHYKTTHAAYAKSPKTTNFDVQELHANMQFFPSYKRAPLVVASRILIYMRIYFPCSKAANTIFCSYSCSQPICIPLLSFCIISHKSIPDLNTYITREPINLVIVLLFPVNRLKKIP